MKPKTLTYEQFIKEFFPHDWEKRHEVCIHCHQPIKNDAIDEMRKRIEEIA